MIEEVYILGQIGRAVYEHDGRHFVLGVSGDPRPVECRPGDISLLFDSRPEVSIMSADESDLEPVFRTLEYRTQAHRALSMALSGLDIELTPGTRSMAIDAAEELAEESRLYQFVRARLLARSLPPTADINRAIQLAGSASAPLMASLYSEVLFSQELVIALVESWNEVAPDYLDEPEDIARTEALLIESGVFADIVSSLTLNKEPDLGSIIVSYALRPSLMAAIPRFTLILKTIQRRLEEKRGILAKKPPRVDKDYINRARFLDEPEHELTGLPNSIQELISRFDKRRNWKPSKAHEVEEKIRNQVEAIGKLIRRGDLARANQFLWGLLQFHLQHSEKDHVAMSLCAIAKHAIDSEAFQTAENLVEYAFTLEVEDAVIWSTQAEIFRAKGDLDRALSITEDVLTRFPNDVYTWCGYAAVLKDTGDVRSAVSVYEEARDRFPNESVPLNGYADAIKCLGELEDAHQIYEKAMEQFPAETVPRNGYADVMKRVGHLDRALSIYEETMRRFPEDVVAYSGYAEILKDMGQFEKARSFYQQAIKRFPTNMFLLNGHASVLVMMGRFGEASSSLAGISEKNIATKHGWISYHILAMLHLKRGETEEAIRRLEYGWRNSNWAAKNYFATALGVARLKKREFSEAVQVLTSNVIYLDVFQEQKRLALLAHSKAGIGESDEAARILANLDPVGSPRLLSLKDALVSRYLLDKSQSNIGLRRTSHLETTIDGEEFILAMPVAA
jgi:tetratricopeptide (TPR) repeat protein